MLLTPFWFPFTLRLGEDVSDNNLNEGHNNRLVRVIYADVNIYLKDRIISQENPCVFQLFMREYFLLVNNIKYLFRGATREFLRGGDSNVGLIYIFVCSRQSSL